jgi:hypothetical protein
MSELSTADLAGGTPTRNPEMREHDADTVVGTQDPKTDMRDAETRTPDTNFDQSSTSTADMAATRRKSDLPNPAATDGADTGSAEPLFPGSEAETFRGRWVEVQTGFVDEPRSTVEQADSLVAEMMKRLAQVFADERGKLEEQWSRGDDISTEDLRQALRRYRSFFDRLLSV